MTNSITPEDWQGICARHSAVEQSGSPTEAAQRMGYLSHLDRRDLLAEIDRLRSALKVAKQAILEFSHAQECGPKWYTHGSSGMYEQVHLWLRRGLEAVREALGPYDDSGQYLKERL